MYNFAGILVFIAFANLHAEARRQPRFMGMIVNGWCSKSGLDCTPPNSECVADSTALYTQQSCKCKSGFSPETYPDRCIPDPSVRPDEAYCQDSSNCRLLLNSQCETSKNSSGVSTGKCVCQPGFDQSPTATANFYCVRKDCMKQSTSPDSYCQEQGKDSCEQNSGRCVCSAHKLLINDKCIDPVSMDINCTNSLDCQLIHPNLRSCSTTNGQSVGKCSCSNPYEKLHLDSGNKSWSCRGQLSGEVCSVDRDCWYGQNLKCWANAMGPGQHRCFCQPYYRQTKTSAKCQSSIGRFCGLSGAAVGGVTGVDVCGRPTDPTKGMSCKNITPTSPSGICICNDGLDWDPEKSSCEPAHP